MLGDARKAAHDTQLMLLRRHLSGDRRLRNPRRR
jgi:hypothetical protein